MSEIPTKDEKLYVSAVFDCFNLGVLGLVIADSMKAGLCADTIKNACKAFSLISGAVAIIWRYFIIYWNNRRICSANGGLPPMVKRKQYYASLEQAA